jgi:hypothetical protein
VRNVRSDGVRTSFGGGGMPPWLRWTLTAGVAVTVLVAGCCGLSVWRMGTAITDAQKAMLEAHEKMEAERKARTIVVTAAELLKEFEEDAAAADRKYMGKRLDVSGIVERSGNGGAGAHFLILHGADEKAELKLECFFDFLNPEDQGRLGRLNKGQTATVSGEYSGRVSHVQMRGCVLNK